MEREEEESLEASGQAEIGLEALMKEYGVEAIVEQLTRIAKRN
jgi:hypothetical protein